MNTYKKRSKLGKIIKIVFVGCILSALVGAGAILFISVHNAPDISAFQYESEIEAGTKLYDAAGNLMDEYVDGKWQLKVSLESIPEYLQQAVIVLEDERFYEHGGIDLKAIGEALLQNLKSGSIRNGGTTITQQVVRNNILMTDNSFIRKIQEQYLALQIEKYYPKDTILECYLNQIHLGAGTQGVQSAAYYYFDKDISELSLMESVVLAVISEYPTRYNPRINAENNWEKAQLCLDKMELLGYISEDEKKTALEEKPYERIKEVEAQKQVDTQSYVIDEVIRSVQEDLQKEYGYTAREVSELIYTSGLEIDTTIDPKVQKVVDKYIGKNGEYINEIYEIDITYSVQYERTDGVVVDEEAYTIVKDETELENFIKVKKEEWGIKEQSQILREDIVRVPQSATSFVVMDYKTGEVRALAGGRGRVAENKYVTQTQRMPGTAFNLLAAYAPSLDMGLISAESILQDRPVEVKLENGKIYTAKSNDNNYLGSITLREAIYKQRNVIASDLLINKVGIEKAFEYLNKFGFKGLVEEDKTAALAQGGLMHGVTTLELNSAYSAIANNGTYITPKLYREVRNANGEVILTNESEEIKVIKEETAQVLNEMMQESAKTGSCQLVQEYFYASEVACEVGRTNNNMDMIFTGYTPYYSATIWNAFTNPKQEEELLLEGEIDVWARIMQEIHEGLETP